MTGDVTGEIVSPAPLGKWGDVIKQELDTRSDAVILNVDGWEFTTKEKRVGPPIVVVWTISED